MRLASSHNTHTHDHNSGDDDFFHKKLLPCARRFDIL